MAIRGVSYRDYRFNYAFMVLVALSCLLLYIATTQLVVIQLFVILYELAFCNLLLSKHDEKSR